MLFTGDNIFHRVKTFIQEADPWQWLATLKRIGQIDAGVIVPGHGEPCDRSYLARQAEIIEAWIGSIEDFGHEWDDDPAGWVRAQRSDDRRAG